jgi:hypothetical protein
MEKPETAKVEFTRRKSLHREFRRLRIDENDLVRLGQIILAVAQRSKNTLDITVVSGDGEETLRSPNPDFFVSSDMPPQIRSVSIALRGESPVSCEVELSAFPRGRAEISADGLDREAVSGVYHELERELESRQAWGRRLVIAVDSFWFTVVTGLVIAAALYSIFDFVLNLASARVQNFYGSKMHLTFAGIGWGILILAMFVGTFPIVSRIKRALPIVEFSGRLSDPSLISRSRILWIITVILVPIVLNVLAALFFDLLK